MHSSPQTYADLAEAAWRWVLDQVRWDGGPWIPGSVPVSAVAGSRPAEPPWDRDGLHSGVGGLAHVLAEIRLARPWTHEEQALADGIADRTRSTLATQTDCTYFDGLVSSLGVLIALDAQNDDGAERAVARLTELATPDGWPQTVLPQPRYLPDARINDLTLGTAGVLLGAVWAMRQGVSGATDLAARAAAILLAEAVPQPTGLNWPMVSERFRAEAGGAEMPNLSHGVAGISAALALAGVELDRPDLVEFATSGAEHLVSLGDDTGEGFVVPRYLPPDLTDQDEITYTWCHGATGTSLLFLALDRAGVEGLGGRPPLSWQRRCLHSVRTSGVPARLHPGFWDNDGRCCGTAGVGDVFLDAWQRAGVEDDLRFAVLLADALVERGVHDGPHAYWQFLEHHDEEPLLPPGVGWMQGAAGIAAYLFRVGRLLEQGQHADTAPRMDTWWALPQGPLRP